MVRKIALFLVSLLAVISVVGLAYAQVELGGEQSGVVLVVPVETNTSSSGGGSGATVNIFDQDLNTTDNVVFANINVSNDLEVLNDLLTHGNIQMDSKKDFVWYDDGGMTLQYDEPNSALSFKTVRNKTTSVFYPFWSFLYDTDISGLAPSNQIVFAIGKYNQNPSVMTHVFYVNDGGNAIFQGDQEGSPGPELIVRHSSLSPADGDEAGQFSFYAKTDSGVQVPYAEVIGISDDVTVADRAGKLQFRALIDTARAVFIEAEGNVGGVGQADLTINEGSYDINFRYETNTNEYAFILDANEDDMEVDMHYESKGVAPSVSSCGTSPSMVSTSTDQSGKVNIGTSSTTSCTITFNSPWDNAPPCAVTGNGVGVIYSATTTTSALIITSTSVMDSDVVMYVCIGVE